MLLRLRPPPTHVLPALGFIGRRVAEPGYHRGQHGKRHPRQRGLRARPRQHDDILRTGAVCAGNKYGSRPPRWSTDKRANYGRPSAGGAYHRDSDTSAGHPLGPSSLNPCGPPSQIPYDSVAASAASVAPRPARYSGPGRQRARGLRARVAGRPSRRRNTGGPRS
jgi:hypothetical protein